MPADYITLKALCAELNDVLRGGRIDKICMPEKDELTLYVRNESVNRILTMSANAQNPRICFTDGKKTNPQTAPSFCMHLRKRIGGGKIEGLSMLGEDRIISLDISCRNELRDETKYSLVAEMMGRYSNILLLNSSCVITDALKQAGFDAATKRCLMPSAKYELPPQSKIAPSDKSAVREYLSRYVGGDGAKYICGGISGIALSTARQILHLADIGEAPFSDRDIAAVTDALDKLLNIYQSGEMRPAAELADGAAKDFCVMPYADADETRPYDTLWQAVAACTDGRDDDERRREHTKHLRKAYKSLVAKLEKNSAKCRERLDECAKCEELKNAGDIILINLSSVKKGDASLEAYDYAAEKSVKISLDITLSPQQNAQSYYKKYSKLKRARAIVEKQLAQYDAQLEYVLSIEPSIDMCANVVDAAELEKELTAAGAFREKTKSKRKEQPARPLAFLTEDFVISAGKNNLQNDKLTFKTACGSDIWVHSKAYHGCHVIIFTENRTVPQSVIKTACEIAAFYSGEQSADKSECVFTPRKNVKRRPDAKPGMVLYTVYETMNVHPDAHNELLKK